MYWSNFYLFWCACFIAYLLVCLFLCLFCWFVCFLACLLVCLLTSRLFVCLFVCLSVCPSVCLFACLSVCLSVCLLVCLIACLHMDVFRLLVFRRLPTPLLRLQKVHITKFVSNCLLHTNSHLFLPSTYTYTTFFFLACEYAHSYATQKRSLHNTKLCL